MKPPAVHGLGRAVRQRGLVPDTLLSYQTSWVRASPGDVFSSAQCGWGLQRAVEVRGGSPSNFAKLATIRNDIAGLFEKLSDAVSASSN